MIHGDGFGLDSTFLADSSLKTTTSQYKCVGFAPGTSTNADKYVALSGHTGTLAEPTLPAAYFIGINQSYMSANSTHCTVRLFGFSKAYCAESIAAGSYVLAYGAASGAASTTTMAGRIIQLDNGVSCGGHSITNITTIAGRALEDGSTGTVITVLINPQVYDSNLVGTIGTT